MPWAAQTVYYNHPKGVAIGGGSGGQTTTVAKLTLPAGTYHVIFKTELTAFGGGINEGVDCAMNVTGIPNLPRMRFIYVRAADQSL